MTQIVPAEILNTGLFQRRVQPGVFDGNAYVTGECLQQLDVVARKEVAFARPAGAHGDDQGIGSDVAVDRDFRATVGNDVIAGPRIDDIGSAATIDRVVTIKSRIHQ